MNNKYTWLHIGLGSFHRAHQAWYLHKLIESGDDTWSISAGNIRNDAEDVVSTLAEQNGEYVLETISPAGECKYEQITSIKKLLPWQDDLAPLIKEGAKAETKVIAFTVTEGGYYLDTNHKLEINNIAIKHDLSGGSDTIYGTITKILEKRIEQKSGSLTLLNCDNVRHNGERFQDGLVEFLTLTGKIDVLEWVTNNTTCPNTMVDRITPRPTVELPNRIKEKTGITDNAPVMGETFIQWVIEDNFKDVRPNLETVNVEMVDSVIPYEEAKIRILNASHSCIAWAGTLVGKTFIHESTLTDYIYNIADEYITQDVIPCLGDNGIDLPTYRDVVLERFTNPYIEDTNQRVAADGFSKIPAMITPTMIECYQRGAVPSATALLPALFYTFMEQWHKGELPYEYQDGILDSESVHTMFNSADPIAIYARDKALFGELAERDDFEALLREKIHHVSSLIR
ncbi:MULTISPECIES: D-arabinitol 4-dehydrogenase [unclassified Aliivibrio]|uniref:D-arabinitol 4-dehydrogenase n=1 Tax=unclassified Aliivibrio TaxID=2645654 RepID=UPI00080DDF34|nr:MULTISPECIES: D-arabinitol 4-dehydrogenase [unclassified Aliivibrio]OCH13724.1 D-arabinitol 4-dehydrogenase [Aliivibrio sp. 1S165]OCH23771.1 D-arabinitol 4-dehydrogenase [Aliivibrio sp. 1S128]OCH31634.1 D-arabinitol 4-dehydrogenase [Aliivibrio sp. 1S175]